MSNIPCPICYLLKMKGRFPCKYSTFVYKEYISSITGSVSWFSPNQLSDLDIEETPKE